MLWFTASFFALLGGIFNMIFTLVWVILTVIARWLVFQKAGQAGWKSIIPFYSDYTFYKIAWSPNVYWLWLICSVVSEGAGRSADGFWSLMGIVSALFGLVVALLAFLFAQNLAKCFRRGILFGIGLWLLEPLFLMILAFGSARYEGNYRRTGY